MNTIVTMIFIFNLVETADMVSGVFAFARSPQLKSLCENHVERHSSVARAREMNDAGESLSMSKSFSRRL
jgi:hypothetical protein